MKISYQWLKDYVNVPAEVSPEEIARKLTFAGLEVEALTNLARGLEKVVVGQILERNKHPNADRLSLTSIDVGTGTPLSIVCGAQNIKAGQKIPVALIGAKIPNGLEIKAAEIRKVPSQGMLCSLEELQFPKEWQAEDGIYLLDEKAVVGTPLAEHLGRNDWIFEINVTPNRGDALSHFGVAREVASLFGLAAKLPDPTVHDTSVKIAATVTNKAGRDLCPRYFGRVVEGVKIGPSPYWLRKKLEAVGLRSINNVVDATSYVMFEMGQPLHAFDADKIKDSDGKVNVTVRTAKAQEKFKTLAAKDVELVEGDLVIAAGADERGVALAGVVGGLNSEVDDKTVNVFLEAAEFNPVRVRKTGRRLATLTDAGYRFERGVDSGRVEWALHRVTDLIVQIAGGKAGPRVMAAGSEQLEPLPQLRIRLTDVQRLLGKAPELQKMIQILRGLQFPCEAAAGEQGTVAVQVPRWRKDIKRTVDLIEEVARIWGFENLESRLPLGGVGEAESVESRRRSYFQVRRIRRHLASLGFFEALNYGFTSPEILARVHSPDELKEAVHVANPVTADHSVMKPSLLSGLLLNVAHNFAHKRKDLRLFEGRRVFSKLPAAAGADARIETGVHEEVNLALLMTGAEVDEFWQGKAAPVDFYSIKGTLESIFELLGVNGAQFQSGATRSFLHPGQAATLLSQNKPFGVVGRLHPRVEKNFDLDQDVFYAEFRLDALLTNDRKIATFKAFSLFPEVERDFSLLVKDNVNAQMIRQLVTKTARPLLQEFHFFDVYKGARVPEGHVSYAFRVVLGALDHTLTDAEISGTQQKIMKELEREFGGRFAGQ